MDLTQIVNWSNTIPLIGFGLNLISNTFTFQVIKSHITYIDNEYGRNIIPVYL